MKKKMIYKLLPYMIMSSLTLSGCGETSECDLPNRHVHLYTKDINGFTIKKYEDNEHLYDYYGYQWNPEYIDINKKDELAFNRISTYNLFDGVENFDYLYNKMAYNYDYLEFEYKYETRETIEIKDDEGNVIDTKEKVETHYDWHKDQYDFDNTGKVRLCHKQYFGYSVEEKNGKWYVERSPYVDDYREILEYYPYVNEDCSTTVTKEHNLSFFKSREVTTEDFYYDFGHPDLENTSPTLRKTK